jgi:hypothetical protein
MLMTTCMYNSKDMEKMAMKQYLVQQKTLPDLSLGEQLAKTGSAKMNVIRAEVLAQNSYLITTQAEAGKQGQDPKWKKFSS